MSPIVKKLETEILHCIKQEISQFNKGVIRERNITRYSIQAVMLNFQGIMLQNRNKGLRRS